MNDAEASALASDIVETWQLTASKRIWIDALKPMADHDAATKAYAKLRRNHQGRDMSVGQFTDEYRRQRPHVEPEPNDCSHCGTDDGWIRVTYWQGSIAYTGVVPCEHCRAGKANERTWRHIREHTPTTVEQTLVPPTPALLDEDGNAA